MYICRREGRKAGAGEEGERRRERKREDGVAAMYRKEGAIGREKSRGLGERKDVPVEKRARKRDEEKRRRRKEMQDGIGVQ